MINETLEADRAYRKDINEAYERGYAQGKADAKPHWIPMTERLPEVKQKVLVQYPDESMATKKCIDAGHLAWFYSNAVAWMPAPASWKREEIK